MTQKNSDSLLTLILFLEGQYQPLWYQDLVISVSIFSVQILMLITKVILGLCEKMEIITSKIFNNNECVTKEGEVKMKYRDYEEQAKEELTQELSDNAVAQVKERLREIKSLEALLAKAETQLEELMVRDVNPAEFG